MIPLSELLEQSATHAWLFMPSAILLGALHGLEPGHSKTMMAAFIIAIRGTVAQAILLGLAATVSHTLVVWAVALAGLRFARQWRAETSEPYFQMVSAVVIIGIAGWMIRRTWRQQHQARHERHDHGHGRHEHGHHHLQREWHGLDVTTGGQQDTHELAHANDIRRRFTDRNVTTGQIVMFGLTGGLIPCPAAITVLLLCLQLRQFTLGVALVICFSIGLAIAMVAAGIIAALSIRQVSLRWSGFSALAQRAPYFSGVVIICVGLYVGWQGLHTLTGGSVI